MHVSSMLRMKWFEENFISLMAKDKIKILDVGSYNVNGTYGDVFSSEKYEYTGLDMQEGPNVDIVLKNPYDWGGIETDSYDVIVSGQTFEHVEFFWITMFEMARVLKQDGLMCIIAPSQWEEHRCPVDCYRFNSDGMVALAKYVSLEILHVHKNCAPSQNFPDWYGKVGPNGDIFTESMLIAKKPYGGLTQCINIHTYKCLPANLDSLRAGLITSNEVCGMWYHDQDGNVVNFIPG